MEVSILPLRMSDSSHPGCVWHPKTTEMVTLPLQAVVVPLLLQLLAALLTLEEG